MDRKELNTQAKHVGNICELIALSKMVKLGWSVSLPFGDNCRYDVVIDKKDGKLIRGQIKSACRPKEKNGEVISIPLETRNKEGYIRYTEQEVDAFIAVDLIDDSVYYIPYEAVNGQRVCKLRLVGGKYNTHETKWAKDFLL